MNLDNHHLNIYIYIYLHMYCLYPCTGYIALCSTAVLGTSNVIAQQLGAVQTPASGDSMLLFEPLQNILAMPYPI